MIEQIEFLASQMGLSLRTLLLMGIGAGCLLGFLGIAALATDRNPAAVRLAAGRKARTGPRPDRGLLRDPDADPRGLAKAFVPTDMSQRVQLARDLAQAGFTGPHAVRNYQMVRVVFGILLPGLLLGLIVLGRLPGVTMPFDLHSHVADLSNRQIMLGLSALVVLGYFGPHYWLKGRVAERRQKIEESFPNALDLMQISVEAGLGFDAAMTRVGNELAAVSPEMSWEFLAVQHQVQAGRPRQDALADMAARTGVDTVRSFASVVAQSMQFGTSMSEALTAYAAEMRTVREMKAQEMANKLPVKMSAVLASL
ncbi:type II secretion system F family protein, partial [Rubellimicrobium roseum]